VKVFSKGTGRIYARRVLRSSGALSMIVALGAWSDAALAHNKFEVDATIGARVFGSGPAHFREGESAGDEGKVYARPALAYGGILGYRVERNGLVYLSFSRQVAPLHLDVNDQSDVVTGKVAIENYQFGGSVERTWGHWVPYFGVSVGAARWASLGGGGSRVFFAAVFDGGVKFDLHKNVHLRLLGRIPFTFTHGDLYCMSAGRCVALSHFSPWVQVEAQFGVGASF
jgi:hypothetical protein